MIGSLSTIRRRMNGRQPINRLPLEILGLIFRYVPSRPAFQFSKGALFMWPENAIAVTSELVELTRVCRHWRDVSLELGSLWTNYQDGMHYPDQFLKRSGAASLKVSIRGLPSPRAVDLLGSNGSRIQELYLLDVNDMFSKGEGIQKYTAFTATRLEHLTLATDGDRKDYNINPDIFAGAAPRLRSLTIQSLTWLPRNQFFNLTQLCIYDRRRGGPNYESFRTAYQLSDFMKFLVGCPKLEDLTLVDIWFDTRGSSDGRLSAISLNSLRRLALGKMIPPQVLTLLSHVANSAGIATRVFGMSCGDRDFLPQLANLIPVHGMKRLQLSVGPGRSFIFAPTTSSRGARVEFNQCTGACAHCGEWINALWSKWPLLSVRELWMTDRIILSRYNSSDRLLRTLPNVTALVITQLETDEQRRKNFMAEFDRLIVALTTSRNAPADSVLYMPHLAVVHLWFCGQPVDPSLLIKFSAARAQLGHPIRQLIVEFASPNSSFDSALSVLRNHVGRVDIRVSKKPPSRDLPVVCTTGVHEFWPSW